MRLWFRLALICILILTGQSLAVARGQARADGQIVICAGTAYTTIWVDRDGKPVEQPHLCPDMALGLMAAVAVPQDAVVTTIAQMRRLQPAVPSYSLNTPVLSPQARDPPLWRDA
ncbi:hypothetical protein [Paracoccus pacificus]|uniref:Uncharacterized protein n=1 Tax=Paracoccus pacificus TaxID=1463598 RepID=A0ABW4R918_9RHOB